MSRRKLTKILPMEEFTSVRDTDLKYSVYIYENGTGEVHDSIKTKLLFKFNNIDELCYELKLRDSTNKYNL